MEIPLLTIGESKVYKSLVELGESSIGNILKESGVSHSKVYDILKRLAKKGLVSSINKNGKQFFAPADPKRLSELIKDKEKEIRENKINMNSIITKLNIIKETTQPKSIMSSFEGMKGMKTVLESILKKTRKNQEILILGTPKIMGEQSGGYLKDWQKRRIEKGIICKILTDRNSTSWGDIWWKKSKKQKKTFTKKSNSNSPSYFVITKDSVTTIHFSKTILTVSVEHQEIATRYVDFFNMLWNQ